MAERAKSRAVGGAEVETYKHKEAKRKNIPTAENQKLVADEDRRAEGLLRLSQTNAVTFPLTFVPN